MDLKKMMAEFESRGGTVKRCETGAKTLNLTDREWASVVRGNRPAALPEEDKDYHELEQQAEKAMERKRDARLYHMLNG
jgi:hypothetical protein